MTTLQERIAGERRRLRSVRQRLSASLVQPEAGADERADFYIAVGDYMEASMARLHAQDVKMGDMIREKVAEVDEGVTQALAELDDRLSGMQRRAVRLLPVRSAPHGDGDQTRNPRRSPQTQDDPGRLTAGSWQ